jgi:hypothetical protein
VAKDQRFFAKFTLDFPSNPKIKPLSDSAFRCLVEATIYSREHLTDGLLKRPVALASWSLDDLQELCTNDDEKPSLIEVENGWIIPDYAEHQDTKSEVEARRERARAAGQKGGLAKAKRPAKRPAKQTASETLSKNVAEGEGEEEITTRPNGLVAARTRGTRLPDPWEPPADVIAQMHTEHPEVNLKAEHAKFTDYWISQPGSKGRKTDWTATWRNWIRRAAENTRPRAPTPTANGHTHDDKVNGYLAFANQTTRPELEP